MPEKFGFFTFDHRAPPDGIVEFMEPLYAMAAAKVGHIHGVILPELSIAPEEHKRLREFVLSKGSFLVAGVGTRTADGKLHGTNEVRFDFPLTQTLRQNKHHRWKLNDSQIGQYGLGSRLHPDTFWWEHISLVDRRLGFVSLNPNLVLSVLICEDLARPDPVGDLIRAVGPNLVIALLMDGPQIKERWPSRDATVLAEDPGCSVLTLTSLGMAMLSRPAGGSSRSRAIALWKDAMSASATEVELPDGSEAVVLSLSIRLVEEWAADGRTDEGNAGYPILSGVHPLRTGTLEKPHSTVGGPGNHERRCYS